MKYIYLVSLLIVVSLFACKDKEQSKNIPNSENQIKTDSNNKEVKNNNVKNKIKTEFSWEKIPISTKDIGNFPFIKPPKGIIAKDIGSSSYSKKLNFSKLKMFSKTSNTTFNIEGKVEFMNFSTEDENANWEQYYFDKSINDYLESIGAIQVNKGGMTDVYYEKYWSDYDGEYTVKHNDRELIRMWVIKQVNKKIGVQIFKKRMAIVEEIEFKQTIVKFTADDILKEINAKGFATLQINFDTGKSRIKASSYDVISEIVKMMKVNSNLKISIEGHTDNVGDELSNMKLSKNRARSVLMAISDEDIDESRLKSEGFGQTKPVENNSTEEGKTKNRRVELRKI
ncbi:OmpA family protein [Tenacibaculum sp. Bg11-29]|uniref:OmpA family protein n=1 Tax=Tenacibaculum sp. Bg11-29 TaxID=2058306 RepID=UPI000C33635A|nr:OmpA family protein [Tenacibaculum sp. Bg11-29]PKH52595.1 OmpA family protein [Tenacibaculum sp. Bg11-29]